MNDTAELLNQLKIDRGLEPPPARRRWIWIAAAVVVLLIVAALLLGRRDATPVTAATAQALDGGAGTSLLDASGYVVARRQATVSSKITGKLQALSIEEGQKVADNEVIARLDDTNARAAVAEAEARLAQARTALDDFRPIHRRTAQQAAEGLISDAALDASQADLGAREAALRVARAALNSALRALDDTVVRAPFAGVITQKAAQPGEIVSPISAGGGFTRTGIGTLVDMDSLEVEVDVNENFINRVRAGGPARARLNAYPDWDIPAEVVAVIPTADRSKATVKVRVGFKTKDARILPEMGVRVSFLSEAAETGEKMSGVTVPAAAVQNDASHQRGTVYVIDGDHVRQREVRLGAAGGDRQTIISGLSAGERVAIGDFARLSDGAKVRVEEP